MQDYFHLEAGPNEMGGISTLGLAHLGDAVYELMVRSMLCLRGKATNKNLHKATVGYVSAQAQARAAERIQPMLTEEERDVFRRGRNSSPHTVSHAASRAEYQTATAVEALFGYLYLGGKTQRLNQLFAAIMAEE